MKNQIVKYRKGIETQAASIYRGLFLAFFAFFAVFMLMPTASAFLDIITYDNVEKKFTLSGWLGLDKQVELWLVENTDVCMDCRARIKVLSDIDIPIGSNSEYLNFLFDNPESQNIYWTYDEEYYIDIFEIQCSKTLSPNGSTVKACEQVKTGTETKTKKVKHDFHGITIEANKPYFLNIEGNLMPGDKTDWILNFRGWELQEWAWWNSSYDYRYNISIIPTWNSTVGSGLPYYILVNSSEIDYNHCNGSIAFTVQEADTETRTGWCRDRWEIEGNSILYINLSEHASNKTYHTAWMYCAATGDVVYDCAEVFGGANTSFYSFNNNDTNDLLSSYNLSRGDVRGENNGTQLHTRYNMRFDGSDDNLTNEAFWNLRDNLYHGTMHKRDAASRNKILEYSPGYAFLEDSGATTNRWAISGYDGTNNPTITAGGFSAQDKWVHSVWHHSCSANLLRGWRNGTQQDISEATLNCPTQSTSTLEIGSNNPGGGGHFWTGMMDEILITSDLKTTGFIQGMYHEPQYVIAAEEELDMVAPNITIINPTNITYNSYSVALQWTANESVTVWLENNTATNVSFNGNYTLNTTEYSNQLTVYARDTNNNVAKDSVNFTILIAPIVTIDSPENITYNKTSIALNVTADEDVSEWWYQLNGGSNTSLVSNTTITGIEGSNQVEVFARDSDNNVGNKGVNFTVEILVPSISLLAPANATYNRTTMDLLYTSNVTITNLRYILNGGSNVTVTDNTTFTATEGSNQLQFYGNEQEINKLGTAGVNFTVDTVSPGVIILSPDTEIYETGNLSLDFTVNETLDSCWFSFNGGSNISLGTDGTCWNTTIGPRNATNYVTVSVNDSAGNVGMITYTFDNIELGTFNYTDPLGEYDSTNYEINISCNTSRVNVTDKMFIFNGTNHSVTLETINETRYKITKDFIIPIVQGAVGPVSIPISFNLTLNNTPTNHMLTNSSASQTVNIIGADNCSTYEVLVFNFSYKDELDYKRNLTYQQNITTTFETIMRMGNLPGDTKNFTFDLSSNETHYGICLSTLNGTKYADVEIKYSATNYEGASGAKQPRYYLLNHSLILGGTNISIYLINDTFGHDPQNIIYVLDENEEAIEDVYIKIKKEYLAEEKWENVTWGTISDADGKSMAWLEGDVEYEFEFWQDYALLDIQRRIIDETNLYFRIVPAEEYVAYGYSHDINFSITFDNITNRTILTYDASNLYNLDKDAFKNACVKVVKRSALEGEETICDLNCSSVKEGSTTLTCDVGSNTGNFIAYATTNITKGDNTREFILETYDFKSGVTGAYQYLEREGLFIMIIVICVMVCLGFFAPELSIGLGLVGFIFTAILGVADLPWGFVIGVICVGGLILIKLIGHRTT